MCDGGITASTAIMIGISVASAAASAASAAQQAAAQKAQADAINARNAEQNQLNNTNVTQQYTEAQTQEQYVDNQAEQKLQANAKAARDARATALTAAGEAGVSGNSVDALSREYYSREGDFAQSVINNRNADTNRLQLQMAGFNTAGQSENNALVPGTEPSDFGTALTIGGDILGGAANVYADITKQKAPKSQIATDEGAS